MVKHYARIWILEEDRNLAKSSASLKGMKLAEYVSACIRSDAPKIEHSFETMKDKKRGDRFGFFK